MRLAVVLCVFLLCALETGTADVIYDKHENCLWVMDYPEEAPATLDTLLEADQKNRWGKVSYDPATDTYTIDTSLWIGIDQGLGTFLQIGRPDHPHETVIVKGNVQVRSPKLSAKRPDGRFSIVNRLTLGSPTDKNIRATLKILCGKAGQYGVQVGGIHRRGDLHVYNGTITAAMPDKDHILARQGWHGSDIRLINATISWVHADFMYGVQKHNSILQGTTFEHGGQVLCNGIQYARDCRFRDLKVAIAEGGCLDATLVRCTFENNNSNWTLGSVTSRGITMIDCNVGPQKMPLQLRKNKITPEQIRLYKVGVYPIYRELRSLVIKVTDRRGKSIPGAMVQVTCPESPEAVTNGLLLTDAAGLTPSDPEKDAILIISRKLQATDDPEKPREFSYTYLIKVQATGYKDSQLTVHHDQPIPKPLVITMQK